MLACFSVLCYTKTMKFDLYKKIYEKNAAFIKSRPLLKKALPLLDNTLTTFFFLAYATLCFYALIKKFGANDLMWLIFPPLLCLLIVSVLRIAVERPRPYTENGANITPFIEKKKSENRSFPSRHIASATVIAGTFLPFFPGIAALLYFFALVLAYVRFAAGLHYISDLAAGGAIGLCIGLLSVIF